MTWTPKANHNTIITNSNSIDTSTQSDIGQPPSIAKYTSYKVLSSPASRTPVSSYLPCTCSWTLWIKRSSNGTDKSSDSPLHYLPQFSPAHIFSASPCQAMPSKPPKSAASGAANIAAPAKLKSPTASSNEPSANKPATPPISTLPPRYSPTLPVIPTAHCGPTPSQKSTRTRDLPSANLPPSKSDPPTSSPPA